MALTRSLLVSVTVLGLALVGAATPAAVFGQPAPAVAALCPAPSAPSGVDVCVDRGDGALYFEGEAVTVCVTVNIPQIAIFPPPPPPTVRITNFLNGGNPHVVFEQAFASGNRCTTLTIVPPFGDETMRADVIGSNGSVLATDTVRYRSAARGGGDTRIGVTVDRGSGSLYAVGDQLTACVTVTPADPARPPRVRLTFSNSAIAVRTIDLGSVASGRCMTITVEGPAGPVNLRAEALDPLSAALLASATIGYAVGQGPAPPPSGPSGPPTRISGIVLSNGQQIATGSTVYASVRGTICGSTFVTNGSYVLDVAAAASRAGCGVDGDVISFTAAGLPANETAIFQSGAFLTLNLTIGGAPPPPPPPSSGGAPTNLTANVLDGTRVQLVWADNSFDEFGFRVYDGFTPIGTTPPNTNAFTVVGLAPGSYHCFRVTALRPGAETAPTDWACVTTGFGGGGGAVPNTPNGLQATVLSATSIQLNWNDTSFNEDGFRISNGLAIVGTLGPGATSYIVGGLTPNGWTCFQVQAFNGFGASAWTDWACATTFADQAGTSAPVGVRATALQPGRVLIEWFDTATNESGFRLSNGQVILAVLGPDTQAVVVDVTPFSWGCFQVQAFGPSGDSAWSDFACTGT